jgi:hypothetical protein
MMRNCFKGLVTFFFVLIVFVIISCQKGVDEILTEPIPDEVKDSTLLVKSINHVWNKGGSSPDSVTEHYFYDSVNKKLLVNWEGVGDFPSSDGVSAVFSYNLNGLLANVTFSVSPPYIMDEYAIKNINIQYDDNNVVKSFTRYFYDGFVDSVRFVKTLLTAGYYKLTWIDSFRLPQEEIVKRDAVFNVSGKPILNVSEIPYISGMDQAGNSIYSSYVETDSVVYDNEGSLSKIVRTYEEPNQQTKSEFTAYEFFGRQTKGNQLYNQRKAILNGIANIPFTDFDEWFDSFGIFSFSLEWIQHQQYSKFPIQSAKVYNSSAGFDNFSSVSEFDSKDRLKKFGGFFPDLTLILTEYTIEYYK